jgi:hypothetical protein
MNKNHLSKRNVGLKKAISVLFCSLIVVVFFSYNHTFGAKKQVDWMYLCLYQTGCSIYGPDQCGMAVVFYLDGTSEDHACYETVVYP